MISYESDSVLNPVS